MMRKAKARPLMIFARFGMRYQSENIDQLATALAAAQEELEPAEKNSVNPHVKKKYADISAVYAAIRSVLPKHGLAVVQAMMPNTDGNAHVRTTLMHKSGQWIAGECILPCDRQGGVQGAGSAITYARRYSLSAMVGVVSEDDDDGAGAMPKKRNQAKSQETPSSDAPPPNLADRNQVQRIQILMKEMGIQDRDERINRTNAWLARNGGGEVASTSELTKQQAARLVATLEKQVAATQAQPGQDPFPQVTQ